MSYWRCALTFTLKLLKILQDLTVIKLWDIEQVIYHTELCSLWEKKNSFFQGNILPFFLFNKFFNYCFSLFLWLLKRLQPNLLISVTICNCIILISTSFIAGFIIFLFLFPFIQIFSIVSFWHIQIHFLNTVTFFHLNNFPLSSKVDSLSLNNTL